MHHLGSAKVLSYFCCKDLKLIANFLNYSEIIISDCNWNWTHINHLVHKRTLNHLAKLAKWLSCVVSTYMYGAFDCMFLSCHVHALNESTLYRCLNVKELLARSRHQIWSLSDCHWTRTHNHLVHKWKLNHLVWLNNQFG